MGYQDKCELNQSKWTLEQFKEWQEICLHCGACVAHGPIIPHNNEELPPDEWQSPERKCPSLEYYKLKTFSGQGRLLLTAAVFRDRTEITDDLTNIMFTCNSCGICNEICPPYLPMHVTLACREEINEKGLPLPEPLPELFENMENKHNLFGLEKRAKSVPDLPEKGTDLYFTGCYTSYLLPEIGKVNAELLRLGGLDVSHFGTEESCCGEVARQAGNRKLLRRLPGTRSVRWKLQGQRE
ncbi:MAG: CoB--CoM heterodisulfide reductase [Herbinix sp.]|nr:CoB--CoM heterodisulfide reductase [Herbinix sp.]